MNRLLILLLAFLALCPSAAAQARENSIAVSLLPEGATARPGQTVDLAFVMRPKPGWHGYWLNPGDAGVATRIDWRLPQRMTAAALRYPVPQRLMIAGLMNYVYERDYALLTRVRVPAGAVPGTMLTIGAKLDYLACTDKICVPETATVSTELRVAASPSAENRAAFDRFRQALPRPLGGEGRFEVKGGQLRLAVPMPASVSVAEPYFFPATEEALRYSAPQKVSRNGEWLIVETQAGSDRPAALEGVLALGEGQGLAVTARPGPVPAAGTPLAGEEAGSPASAGFLLALGGALLGGLLLNVMPCVFPILSLKALSLARAGGHEGEARREALAYTAGVVLVCVALGAILLAVRAGGAAVGWAFQLQDPRVTLILLLLVVALALNLAGLFELPAFGGGEGLAGRGGMIGAFWTGALAAFVATPCTGPFMGAALGAALVLPAASALAVFGGLGLGLALPFLALGYIPALRRRLPRPGPWMSRLRHILAVPMALTAVWLGWLLWRQTGQAALLTALAAALALALALWWAGRRPGWIAALPAAGAVALALAFLPVAEAPAQAGEPNALGAEPFSEARLAALRAEGRPIFLYFTADWCLTCKVNERAVLDRAEVAGAFERRKVAVLVGDWTRGDAEIGRFLDEQGRSGVPLYLWYAPGKPPEVLPQILTVGRVAGLAP